ncbi:MAG: DUF6062 family protein [Spirochaeta sp.]|jgi:hypothetical protein|nr:DUF6062 family protein [Spirochaeta sp.]
MAYLHIDYHAVLEAFRSHSESCPLCAMISEGERAFWDSTLYGAVGTEGFQDAFLASNGFCPHHTRDFTACNDGVAVTMLYVPLLRHRRRWIEASQRGALHRGWRTLGRILRRRDRRSPGTMAAQRGELASPHDCMLCDRIEMWSDQFLTNLLRHQTDAELRGAVENGTGLCVTHYRRLAERGGGFALRRKQRVPRPAPWLQEFHRDRWDAIVSAAESAVHRPGGAAWRTLITTIEGDSAIR